MTQQPNNRPSTPHASRRPAAGSPTTAAPVAKGGGKNKKIANSLVALGSAAIISVYGLGYMRTETAVALYDAGAPSIAIATSAPAPTDAVVASPLYPSATVGSVLATATTSTASVASSTSTPVAAVAAPATATTAPATTAPTATTASATTAAYKDGTYTGTGTSRHGDITASVVVKGGKIVSADIAQCGTRYPCSKIAALPGQVVARQSATVDLVSGATDSSRAYQGAIANALANAKAT